MRRTPPIAAVICSLSAALAQTEPQREVVVGNGCVQPLSHYLSDQYRVGKVEVDSPFSFLGFLNSRLQNVAATLPQKAGAVFDDGLVTKGAAQLTTEAGTGSPSPVGVGLPVKLNAVAGYIQNCDDEAETLDVYYRVFTSELPFFSGWTFEAKNIEENDPAKGAGLVDSRASEGAPKPVFSMAPKAGYTAATKLAGGATTAIRNIAGTSFIAAGSASNQQREISAGIYRFWSPGWRWFESVDFRGEYTYDDRPSEESRLKRNLGRLQADAILHRVGQGPLVRAGLAFEGGNVGSRFLPHELPEGTIDRTDLRSMKSYVGLSYRGHRQSIKASVGAQWGGALDLENKGFRKEVIDVAHRLRLSPFAKRISEQPNDLKVDEAGQVEEAPAEADTGFELADDDEAAESLDFEFFMEGHSAWELETRFTAGWIQNNGGLPVSERFFGGNIQEDFVSGSSWRIRSNPVLRSFAQNRFSRVAGGQPIGAERFVALNLTFSPTVWNKHLMPRNLTATQEFRTQVNFALNSGKSALANYHADKDPAAKQIVALLPAMRTQLGRLASAMRDASTRKPELEDSDPFLDCSDAASLGDELAAKAAKERSGKLDFVLQLMGEAGQIEELGSCVPEFQADLGPSAATALAELRSIQSDALARAEKIDNKAADAKATRDLRFVRGVLRSFIEELNIVSIAPVFIFDAARIGPQPAGAEGLRYGVGAGIRVSLAEVAPFYAGIRLESSFETLGKAGRPSGVNRHHRPALLNPWRGCSLAAMRAIPVMTIRQLLRCEEIPCSERGEGCPIQERYKGWEGECEL